MRIILKWNNTLNSDKCVNNIWVVTCIKKEKKEKEKGAENVWKKIIQQFE